MIKIEIKQNQVTFQSRSGVSAKTGREYKLLNNWVTPGSEGIIPN